MSCEEHFAANFAAFLRENFPTPAHAAVWTGKSIRQIDNYLAEICRPSPEIVAQAFTDPSTAESARRLLSRNPPNARSRPLDHRDRNMARPMGANGSGRLSGLAAR